MYRKPTNKNDYIHFFSHHNNKIKSGILIGSQLRALRICSPQFLQTEELHIDQIFRSLSYPTHFIKNARRKAYRIYENTKKYYNKEISSNNNSHNNTSNNSPIDSATQTNDRYLVLPNNKTSTTLAEQLKIYGYKIVNITSDTIRQFLNKPKHTHTDPEAGIYQIPCASCDRSYYGQSARSLKKRIAEHKRDLKFSILNNSLVKHNQESNHLPSFSSAKVVKYCNNPKIRKILESAIISTHKNYNHRPGPFSLAKCIAYKIVQENNINPVIDKG